MIIIGRRRTIRSVLAIALALIVAAALAPPSEAAGSRRDPIVMGATPTPVQLTGLPCRSGGDFTVSMINTGNTPLFADMTLSAPQPLTLSRYVFSSYLPATDPDQEVDGLVQARVPRDAAPGNYQLTLQVGRRQLKVPVQVDPVPVKGPGDNLALGEQAFASSTHGNVRLCGGVDGNADSEEWGASGTHDATASVFPDTYGVELFEPARVNRVEIYTLNSSRYPASEMGLRDFDIQIETDGGWQTVSEIRGNVQGHVTAVFPPQVVDRVQVVTHDSNDHKYSWVVELEVYGD